MLEISRTLKTANHRTSLAKILGVGNAGVNLIDRFTIERSSEVETVAINTDMQSLVSSVADFKISIGEKIIRGLGTGGNPAIGKEAAYASQQELHALLEGAGLIVICAGLGGGTASGTLPVLLELARDAGVLTAVVATLPFYFEGALRMRQAQAALEKIRSYADILLAFENDRMLENAQSEGAIGETFAKADLFLTQAAMALTRLLSGTGPLQLSSGDLATILQPSRGTSLFGFGQADGGPQRALNALEKALQNPLLDRTRLSEAHRLLIHIDGSSDLLLSEVQTIVQSISDACNPSTHLLLGINTTASVYTKSSGPIAISILGISLGVEEPRVPEQNLPIATSIKTNVPPSFCSNLEISLPLGEPAPETIRAEELLRLHPASPPAEPAPAKEVLIEPLWEEPLPTSPLLSETAPSSTGDPIPSAHAGNEESIPKKISPKPRQEVLKFEPVARGRFEKSEPTIVEGEDIDVPTFLRLKIKLK